MNRSECIRRLSEEYRAQRDRNEAELSARMAEIDAIDPQIELLRQDNARIAVDTMRRLLDPALTQEQRAKIGHDMRDRGLKNNAEMRAHLKAAGYPEDYLTLHYRCEKCRDTGYVGDAPAVFCECFKNALARMSFEEGSAADRLQCFERFDLSVFPEEDGQRRYMEAARQACERYADGFPDTPKINLLFTGDSGLGKTYLLNCIYERVVSRGCAATRITAFRMLEAMRHQHMANTPEEMEFDPLLKAPLLLIDDLGTEPFMRNITVEYLFTLLNERMAAGLHTVIATNLSPNELQKHYGERVASRLLDRRNCMCIEFKGKDLRRL